MRVIVLCFRTYTIFCHLIQAYGSLAVFSGKPTLQIMKRLTPAFLIFLSVIFSSSARAQGYKTTEDSPEYFNGNTVGFRNPTGSGDEYIPRLINGRAIPVELPLLQFTASDISDAGKYFLANQERIPFLIIYTSEGFPVWYRMLDQPSQSFGMQPNGTISYWEDGEDARHVILNDGYGTIARYRSPEGKVMSADDFLITPTGQVFQIVSQLYDRDMSAIIPGGREDARVREYFIQGLDLDNMFQFEWDPSDYFLITDAVHEDLLAGEIDYLQINALDEDHDGKLLVSVRNQSECLKVDPSTGKVMWRLGGAHNQFTWLGDTLGISYQSDFTAMDDHPGHYLIFDNGTYREPAFSRVIEISIDTVEMTAEVVREIRYPGEDISILGRGSTRQLGNGNIFIGWSDTGRSKIMEVSPEGEVVKEADLERPGNALANCYDWTGIASVPYLFRENHPYWVTLIFDHFGRDDIDHYKVYSGTNSHSVKLLGTTEDNWYNISDLDQFTRYYFKVTSVDGQGIESDFSNTVGFRTMFYGPGENMIRNGDFSESTLYWALYSNAGAHASGRVNEEGSYRLRITDGGDELWQVQLIELHVPLVYNRKYRLEFDAWATSARSIRVNLSADQPPYTEYSGNDPSSLESELRHFSYDFTMQEPTDIDARIVVNAGGDTHDVFIDNLRLTLIDEPVLTNVPDNGSGLSFNAVYRNEAGELQLVMNLIQASRIKLMVYSSEGRLQLAEDSGYLPAGYQSLNISFSGKPGVYLVRAVVTTPGGKHNFLSSHFTVN